MSEPYVRIRNLGVKYGGTVALDDVSLQLAKGGRLALIGESGSGKSTLAMAIAGLLPRRASSSGTIEFPDVDRDAIPVKPLRSFHGIASARTPRLGKDIGVLFQDPGGSLDPVMKIGDQIAEVVMTHQGMGWIAARVRAAELLDRVHIPKALSRLNYYPHEFSGGQKQRIALAGRPGRKPVAADR